MNPVTIMNSNDRIYSEDQIRKIAKLLGVNGEKKFQQLYDQMERAVFDYRLALEDDIIEPALPPSKLTEVIAAPANALEQALGQIHKFPRQARSDLLRVANEIGDRIGQHSGATDFFEVVSQIEWVIKCLRDLENRYRGDVAQQGGNREKVARKLFYDSLYDIIEEWHDGPLTGWVDTSEDKSSGPLPEFLEISFAPIKHPPSLNTLVKAFTAHAKAKNNLRPSDNVP